MFMYCTRGGQAVSRHSRARGAWFKNQLRSTRLEARASGSEPTCVLLRSFDGSMVVYAGWRQVGLMMGLQVVGMTASPFAIAQWVQLGLVLPPEQDGLGWSQLYAGSFVGSATVAAGALTFVAGVLVDRLGPTRATLLTSTLLAAACGLASLADAASPFSIVGLWCAFFAFGLSGSGFLQLIPKKLLSYWFLRRRGRAFSAVEVGVFIGVGTMPFVNLFLIETVGWRQAWRVLGVVQLLWGPVSFCFLRDSPDSLPAFERDLDGGRPAAAGTGPARVAECDGGEAVEESGVGGREAVVDEQIGLLERAAAKHADDDDEISLTVREALQTRTLWAALTLVVLRNTVMQGFDFHLIGICAAAGHSPAVAASMLAGLSVSCCVVNVISGLFAERGESALIVLTVIGIIFTGVTLMLAAAMISTKLLAVAAVTALVFGLAETQYVGLTCGLPFYFGKEHIGAISGIYYSVRLGGMGAGPALVGGLAELYGYEAAMLQLLGLPALSLLAAVFFTKPKPQSIRRQTRVGHKSSQLYA